MNQNKYQKSVTAFNFCAIQNCHTKFEAVWSKDIGGAEF